MSAPEYPEISFVSGGVELIDDVGPLWEQLRDFHARIGGLFGAEIASRTFQNRIRGWQRADEQGDILIDLAWADESVVGYCVTTINVDDAGTIDSLYVAEAFRCRGIGDRLMRRALHWLDDNGVTERYVEVIVTNDRALAFYTRYGFAPRTVVMKQAVAAIKPRP